MEEEEKEKVGVEMEKMMTGVGGCKAKRQHSEQRLVGVDFNNN